MLVARAAGRHTAVRALLVHGGVAGASRGPLPDLSAAVHAGLAAASALDAVEASVRVMEDDPRLNAGFGSVLNRAGTLELDAGICDGATRTGAGVASVQVRNPISLARRVLDETPHVLLTGTGAVAIARGMEVLADSSPEQRVRWETARVENKLDLTSFGDDDHVDTVGTVALDDAGDLAAGSSTGGVFGKMAGRVGDSPILGAGVYASRNAAVVGTGVGELFLRTMACLRTGLLIEQEMEPQTACETVIAFLGTIAPLAAGVLAIDSRGRIGAAYRGATWAVYGSQGQIQPVLIT